MRASWPDPEDIRACRAALRAGSSSFHTAGLLLPRAVRDHASALYAFCRVADDIADAGGRADRIDALRARLDAAYAGRPRNSPVDRAFAAVVDLHGVPRAVPEALLEGLAWDVEGRTYETLSDLEAYAARVAGTVGVMMALVMGTRDAEALARAADLGVAMQLTNIARDVGEDARMGRIYLPRAWLREAGIAPEDLLQSKVWSPALRGVVARLLGVAEGLYRRATGGISHLPFGCRTGIHAARLIYAEIGHLIVRAEIDPLRQRAIVPTRRKLSLVARAGVAALVPTPPQALAPALDATRFLVTAATSGRPAMGPAAGEGRIVWLLALFERLERQKARA
jgi:phytoene synthase